MNEELATFPRRRPLENGASGDQRRRSAKGRVQAAKSTGKERTAAENGRSSSLLAAMVHPSSRCCNVIPKRRKPHAHPRPIPGSADANWRCLELNRVSPCAQPRTKRRRRLTRTCDSAVFRAVLQQLRNHRADASSLRATCGRRRGSTRVKNGVAQLLDAPTTLTDSPSGALRNFGRMLQ
jgi:hypothetical protein